MFDEIVNTIFPDECQVLEIVPDVHYVFPIFKNGSSSLMLLLPVTNWRLLQQEQIEQIKQPITVYLRNPKDRFLSGVNTYIQQLERDHPGLDRYTVLWFVNRYLFLNRHYCPQFFWLINLARYADQDMRVKFQSLESLREITLLRSRADIVPASKEFLIELEKFDWNRLELYLFLDQLLIDRIGQEWRLGDLFDTVRRQFPDQYKAVFGKSTELCSVLSQT